MSAKIELSHMKYCFNIVLIICLFLQSAVAQTVTSSYGEGMANTVMALWKDSLVHSGRPAIWSYDQGVVYNGFADLWKYTGNADYFRYIKKHIDSYLSDDGSI